MKTITILGSILISTTTIFAGGPHDAITCLGCHSAHFAMGNKAFAVKNTGSSSINPRTGEKLKGLVADRCLGCHQLEKNGGAGIRPIHLHITHPIGMIPNRAIADVPESLLNDGKLDCISCHEAHPSNDNFMYLRVDTNMGKDIEVFCVVCHSAKADLKEMGLKNADDIKVFSAMNQSIGATTGTRASMRAHNETPNYIQPLGEVPKNTITPNYLSKPAWVDKPEEKYIQAIQRQMGFNPRHIEVPKVEIPKAVLQKLEDPKTEEPKKEESKNAEKNVHYEFNRNGYIYVPTDDDKDYQKINL